MEKQSKGIEKAMTVFFHEWGLYRNPDIINIAGMWNE
jgi:hypothetical protein